MITYLKSLLCTPWKYTLPFLSSLSGSSHDQLNRVLKKKLRWERVYTLIRKGLDLDKGYLIIDETDIDHSYGKLIKGALWVFSHRKNKHVFGYHLVVMCWTNEIVTIPIAWKIYDVKTSEKKITKLDMALDLIKYATNKLHIHPKGFLFDAFYASKTILKYLDERGYLFYSQLSKNRKLDGMKVPLHEDNRPYWTKQGVLTSGLKVQVCRHRKKYFVTNDMGIDGKKQRSIYHIRWKIEETFRFSKQSFGLEKCQGRDLRVQMNHFHACFILAGFCSIESEKTQTTNYQLKLQASFDSDPPILSHLTTLFPYA